MQLAATLQLSQPTLRHVRQANTPVKAFSAGSAYLGRQIEHNRLLGSSQLHICRRRSSSRAAQPVRAFLGVGAPEAILVGVVALVVFGPKGLAQAAKSVGSTLRAFAPTLREITSVSQELKSTLENEIGFNEIREELSRPMTPTPRPAAKSSADPVADVAANSSESGSSGQQGAALSELADSMQRGGQGLSDNMAAMIDPEIERKRAEASAAAWGGGRASAGGGAAGACRRRLRLCPCAACC